MGIKTIASMLLTSSLLTSCIDNGHSDDSVLLPDSAAIAKQTGYQLQKPYQGTETTKDLHFAILFKENAAMQEHRQMNIIYEKIENGEFAKGKVVRSILMVYKGDTTTTTSYERDLSEGRVLVQVNDKDEPDEKNTVTSTKISAAEAKRRTVDLIYGVN